MKELVELQKKKKSHALIWNNDTTALITISFTTVVFRQCWDAVRHSRAYDKTCREKQDPA